MMMMMKPAGTVAVQDGEEDIDDIDIRVNGREGFVNFLLYVYVYMYEYELC